MPEQKLVFPNRENVTSGHVQNLLSVAQMALGGLIHPWRLDGAYSSDGLEPKMAEGRVALENTLIKTCERLDSLLDDSRRWGLENQMELEAGFNKAHQANLRYLENQAAAAQSISTPHFRYKPQLFRLVDGTWAAFLGDVEDMDNGIYGVGRFPEEALEMFDKLFQGQPLRAEVMEWLKSREQSVENGTETKPYPKNTNDVKEMDPVREPEIVSTAGGETAAQGHREAVAEKSEISGLPNRPPWAKFTYALRRIFRSRGH